MHRKLTIILMLCFMFINGCQSTSAVDEQTALYDHIIETISSTQHYDDVDDFDVKVTYTPIDDHYYYNVVINQPRIAMYHITLVSYCDAALDDIHPSLGIYDQDFYSLKPHYINKEEGFYKGIALNGRLKEIDDIQCFIHYYTDEKLTKEETKIFEVHYENR